MSIGELISEMRDAGLIVATGNPDKVHGLELNAWLDRRGVDADTPIPTWNEDAQAWEV